MGNLMSFNLFESLTKDGNRLGNISMGWLNELYRVVKKEAAPNICQPEFIYEYNVFVDAFYHYSDAIRCLKYGLKLPAMIMCRVAIDSCLWKTTIRTHTNEYIPGSKVEGGRYDTDLWIKPGWDSLKRNAIQ